MGIRKEYIPVKSIDGKGNTTHLRVELYYDLGGINYFTYREERRGYYGSVIPVARDGIMEGFTAFTGIKKLIKEVSRKSAKAEDEAAALWATTKQELIDHVLRESGLEIVR